MRALRLALTLGCVALGACVAPPPKPPLDCETWATESSRAIESAPDGQRYERALEAIGNACSALPAALRGGARAARKRISRQEQGDLLIRVARDLLPASCIPWSALSPATDIAGRCPLEPALGVDADALAAMDGASYAFLRALQKGLSDAQIYSPATERLLLAFALSAARDGYSATSAPRRAR